MNGSLRTLFPSLSDKTCLKVLLQTSRGQTRDKPFVSQSLIELFKDDLATCAQRDAAHAILVHARGAARGALFCFVVGYLNNLAHKPLPPGPSRHPHKYSSCRSRCC